MNNISVQTGALCVVLCCCCCWTTEGYEIKPPIPVQSTTPGIRYNPYEPRPKVILEMFIELHCGDSKRQWPILKDVQAHYGNNKLDLVVQQMPLPYHRNAFLATQGMFLIQESLVSAHLFDYIEASLQMEQNFSDANTVNMSGTEVLNMIADMAVEVTGIDKNEFISNIGNYRFKTTGTWKFGVKRLVAATPSFFVNGVDLGIGISTPTYEDWITYLDKIIT